MKPSSKRRAHVALSHGWHHESISSWQGAVAVQIHCWCAPGAGAVAAWCWGSPARGDTTLAFGDGCSSLFEQTPGLPLKPGGFERCLPLHSLVISLLLKNQALPRSANINIMLLVCLMAMWLDCSSEGDDVCWAVVPLSWWCLDSVWWTRARSGTVAAACAGLGLTLV